MYRKIALVAIAVVALSGMLWAEEVSMEARAEKLGALRSRVSAKLAELTKLTDNGQNGVGAVTQTLEYNWQQLRGETTKRVQAEVSKSAETRDQALLDTLVAKSAKLDKLWADHLQDWQTYSRTMSEPLGGYQNMAQLYQYTSAADQPWLRAGLDPDVLTAVFAAMDKRLDEIKSAVIKSVVEVKKSCDQHLQQTKE